MSPKIIAPFSLLIVSLFALFVAGCSKGNELNDGVTPVGLTARINGNTFQSFQAAAGLYANYYQVGGAGTIDGDSVFLTIYIATPVVLNQQISTDDNPFAEIDYVLHQNNVPYAGYSAYQGQKGPAYYTVTAIDTIRHTITGTFSGNLARNGYTSDAPDSMVITNGTFNDSYIQ